MDSQIEIEKEKDEVSYNGELIASLRLLRSERIGVRTYYDLLRVYGSPNKALQALPEIARNRKQTLKIATREEAEGELEKIVDYGATLLPFTHRSYPKALKLIADPPPIIAVRGRTELLHKSNVAIVGTRNASANSLTLTSRFAKQLSENGYNIVSGLARGIDTEAHQASLAQGTIAVLAGGIDHIYPPENAKLYAQIAEQGLLIAEMPFGTAPTPNLFPRRNRIISGLAEAVVVMEASLNSGSLITADYAVEQNRIVAAIPASPLDPRARGNNHLLKQGAVLVESVTDLLSLLSAQPRLADSGASVKTPEITKVNLAEFANRANIEAARKHVLSLLDTTPIEFEQLASYVAAPLPVLILAVLELELSEDIERHLGNRFSRRLEDYESGNR